MQSRKAAKEYMQQIFSSVVDVQDLCWCKLSSAEANGEASPQVSSLSPQVSRTPLGSYRAGSRERSGDDWCGGKLTLMLHPGERNLKHHR